MSDWTVSIETMVARQPSTDEIDLLTDKLAEYGAAFGLRHDRLSVTLTVAGANRLQAAEDGTELVQAYLTDVGLGYDPVVVRVLTPEERIAVGF